MKQTNRSQAIDGNCNRDRLPLSTFGIVMIWSLPAYGAMLYQSGGEFGDIDVFDGPGLAFCGGIVVAGWLMIALWLTNGKIDQRPCASTDAIGVVDEIVVERLRWFTPNQRFCLVLIATVAWMIFVVHRMAPVLSFTVAGAILWTTLGALAPALYRQLTGRPIRYRPDLGETDTESTSSLGVRGLLVLTFGIAAAIAASRRLAGGDLMPLYQPAVMGILGGLTWISMVFSSIGRKRRFVLVAIGLMAMEAIAAGQWVLLSPAIDSEPVESVILFIVSVRMVGWVYLSVMRASGYRTH